MILAGYPLDRFGLYQGQRHELRDGKWLHDYGPQMGLRGPYSAAIQPIGRISFQEPEDLGVHMV